MTLGLSDVALNPKLLTRELKILNNEKIIFKPLENKDIKSLSKFLKDLSLETRKFYTCKNYNYSYAKELCDAINRYDKLRFIVLLKSTNKIISLMEFSFDIPDGDHERYLKYGINLTKTDCRFGPCISDEYQDKGIGSAILPSIIDIARKFGQKRIILWGGVLVCNKKAIHFYEKNGFKNLGTYENIENGTSFDMILYL